MRFISALTLGVLLLTTACANKKFKTFTTVQNFKTGGRLIEGKTPKEAKQILGEPMSVYYNDDKTIYYMVYPLNDTDVKMTDIMFNDRLECLAYNFEKENNFKFKDWSSNTGFTCGAIKGQKLDTSLID